MKSCVRCKEIKDFIEFTKRSSSKSGYHSSCKSCTRLIVKNSYKKHCKNQLSKKKQYYIDNPDKLLKTKERNKKYREENKEKIEAKHSLYRKNNRKVLSERNKKYYQDNIEKIRLKHNIYSKLNMPNYSKYVKKRKKVDSLFKLTLTLRCRTNEAFRLMGYKKGTKTEKVLGASFKVVKKHLEEQFKEGMSWENHGVWHIDHIIPLSSAKTEFELHILCKYTNLQPLWAKDNLSKGNKIIIKND